jgi:hypothetical protein
MHNVHLRQNTNTAAAAVSLRLLAVLYIMPRQKNICLPGAFVLPDMFSVSKKFCAHFVFHFDVVHYQTNSVQNCGLFRVVVVVVLVVVVKSLWLITEPRRRHKSEVVVKLYVF